MSCGLMIAAALMLTDPTVAAASAVTPSAETPVAGESLFLDIVSRSQTLKGVVDGWIETGFDAAAFAGFRQDAEALAALDMQGHITLRDRNVDGDLKCILRGIAEDMPGRLDAIQNAPDDRERGVALSELSHLLDDNAAVILAPPQPAS
ncbi:hypothetical protein IWC96_13430 [Brevundimonas sp. BAL450]|uniref:hypothetical protein n=2 Tax=Brevundimonas TaxID=41275 RepID=UPI0018C91C4E|nr:hypothetical protein [Brevundimonas sp. BAL450]MBG7616273.1 hypothetical protein [Brevundimonas sp. BAL450]